MGFQVVPPETRSKAAANVSQRAGAGAKGRRRQKEGKVERVFQQGVNPAQVRSSPAKERVR